MLKALVNQLKHGELEPERIAPIRGWIAYLRSVKPAFVIALQRKYNLNFEDNLTWNIEQRLQ